MCATNKCEGKLQTDPGQDRQCLKVEGEMQMMFVRGSQEYCNSLLQPVHNPNSWVLSYYFSWSISVNAETALFKALVVISVEVVYFLLVEVVNIIIGMVIAVGVIAVAVVTYIVYKKKTNPSPLSPKSVVCISAFFTIKKILTPSVLILIMTFSLTRQ